MTETEGDALCLFLQSAAVAVVNFLNQAPPEDRTVANFQQVFDCDLNEMLKISSARMMERYALSTSDQSLNLGYPETERTSCSSDAFSDLGTGEKRRSSGTGSSTIILGCLRFPQ